jgi:hypothetical protein
MRFWICLSVILMNNLFAAEPSQQSTNDNSQAAQPAVQTAPQLPKNDQSAAANRLVKSVIERNRILFGPGKKQ